MIVRGPFLALAALLALSPLPACGFSVRPPHSFIKLHGDRYVIVLRVKNPSPKWAVGGYLEPANAETAARLDPIDNKKYLHSGLYRVGDADTPLWTTDWEGYEQQLALSDDGSYMVFCAAGPIGSHKKPLTAERRAEVLAWQGIGIYYRGKRTAFRPAAELLTDPESLAETDFNLPWLAGKLLDSTKETLEVYTRDGAHTVVDLRTGEIRSQAGPRPTPSVRGLVLAFGLVGLLGGVVLLIFRLRHRRRPALS